MNDKTTHFGNREVPEQDKAGLVHGVFSSVAARYDLMNDLMSGGVHRLWKDAMMDWLAPRPGQRLLDVAGGTGDIAFRFLRRAEGSTAVVCDMTEAMLVEGRKRAEAAKLAERLDWIVRRRHGAAVRRPPVSTPIRSASASATSPASPTHWRKPSACCAPAGG